MALCCFQTYALLEILCVTRNSGKVVYSKGHHLIPILLVFAGWQLETQTKHAPFLLFIYLLWKLQKYLASSFVPVWKNTSSHKWKIKCKQTRDTVFWMKLLNQILSALANRSHCVQINCWNAITHFVKAESFLLALLKLQFYAEQCKDNLGIYGV